MDHPPVPPTPPPPPPPPDGMQFDMVEYAPADSASHGISGSQCVNCKKVVAGEYYEVNGQVFCPDCKAGIQSFVTGGSKTGRMIRAFIFGLIAMILSALAYYLSRRITGWELGIATIAMGWLVGWAVHRGASGRGGWFYQMSAVLMTYCAIAFSYVPELFETYGDNSEIVQTESNDTTLSETMETPVASEETDYNSPVAAEVITGEATLADDYAEDISPLVAIPYFLFFILTLPVFMGMESPIMILIYVFGMWQAFQMNRRPHINVSGPYNTGGGIATDPQTDRFSSDNKIL